MISADSDLLIVAALKYLLSSKDGESSMCALLLVLWWALQPAQSWPCKVQRSQVNLLVLLGDVICMVHCYLVNVVLTALSAHHREMKRISH